MLSFSHNLSKLSLRNELCASARLLLRNLSTCVEEEYSAEPKYPPILDVTYKAVKERDRQAWYDKIQNLQTVEEKMIELNMPRYYGWKCDMLHEGDIPYNSLAFAQYITRTHFINGLPAHYQQVEEEAQQYASEIKDLFTEALLFELQRELPVESEEDVEERQVEQARSQAIVEQLNTVLCQSLGRHLPHLKQAWTDPEPRLEAAWVVGGMDPSESIKEHLKRRKKDDEKINAPRDRYFQYIGKPILQLRNEVPLTPFLDAAECESSAMVVPEFIYNPKVLTYDEETRPRRHVTNIPGYWPGDKHQFGLLSFHARSHMLDRPQHFGEAEHQETLHTQAILASYGWLHAQACLLGFSTYNDVTSPLVTQTVITNGKLWSLFAYQLNTTKVHTAHAKTNPKRNVCWGSPTFQLFDGVENGKLIGLNEDLLRTLIKLYINTPEHRDGVELRPYLDPNCSSVAHIEDPERRQFLENIYKHLMSNRPRHRLLPEIHPWEMIYKIKFNTRPMEARRRPFELWQKPYLRRLDDHAPAYIPKAIRKEKKEKFAKTYYP